jgi:hypothetical protein
VILCNTDFRDADAGCTVWDDAEPRVPTAAENGWAGFDNLGEFDPDDETWGYVCDGMPSMMGCPAQTSRRRRWTTQGRKGGGWVVTYGVDPDDRGDDRGREVPDLDVVLVFCPRCVGIMKEGGYPPVFYDLRAHVHEWVVAGPTSAAGSTLMGCSDESCSEVGYRLDQR